MHDTPRIPTTTGWLPDGHLQLHQARGEDPPGPSQLLLLRGGEEEGEFNGRRGLAIMQEVVSSSPSPLHLHL